MPQSGVLSPILFNLYIADVVNCVKSHIFFYADDIALVSPIHTLSDRHILHNNINNLVNYFKNSDLLLNQENFKNNE